MTPIFIASTTSKKRLRKIPDGYISSCFRTLRDLLAGGGARRFRLDAAADSTHGGQICLPGGIPSCLKRLARAFGAARGDTGHGGLYLSGSGVLCGPRPVHNGQRSRCTSSCATSLSRGDPTGPRNHEVPTENTSTRRRQRWDVSGCSRTLAFARQAVGIDARKSSVTFAAYVCGSSRGETHDEHRGIPGDRIRCSSSVLSISTKKSRP